MDVAALHQTEFLACIAAHLQAFEIEFAREGIESANDIADSAIAMLSGMRSFGLIRQLKHARIGFLHHLLAVVNGDQVLLEDIMVEHVLRRFTQVEYPLS